MNHPLRLLLCLAGALLLSSCYYDPYYGSSYSSYGGSYSSYGYAPSSWIIRTSNSRWGYDPYRRCYYDYHHRHYYNPVSYSYYKSPPRRYKTAYYPKGYVRGRGYCPAPRYDHRRVKGLPPRHHDSRSHSSRNHSSRNHHSGTQTRVVRGRPAPPKTTYQNTGYRYDNNSRYTGSRDSRGSGSSRTYTPSNQRGSQGYDRGGSSRGSGNIQRGNSGSSRGSMQGRGRTTTTAGAPTGNRGGSSRVSSAPAPAPKPITRVIRGRTYTTPANKPPRDDD